MPQYAKSASDLEEHLRTRGMEPPPLALLVAAGTLLGGESIVYAEAGHEGDAWLMVVVTNTQVLSVATGAAGNSCWSRPVAAVQAVSIAGGKWNLHEGAEGYLLYDAAWTLDWGSARTVIPATGAGRMDPRLVAEAMRAVSLVHTKWDLADDPR